MSSIPRELAAVTQAKAYQIGDFLVMHIAGEKPSGCHLVDLERSLLDVEPPAFIATWFVPPNVRCVPEPVLYEYQEEFLVGPRREAVTLYHAEGEMSVEVEDLTPRTTGMVIGPGTRASEAVGFSDTFAFDEAFRDAIDKIPVPPIPDWLATYTVLEIGAEIGGITRMNRMFVRVRGG